MRLHTTISTKTAQVGDRFQADVSAPVHVSGVLAIPEGSRVSGHVILAKQPGKASGRGELQLAYDEIGFDGRSYQLNTRSQVYTSKSGTTKDVALIGGGAVAGGVVGGVAGGKNDIAKGAAIGGAAGTAAVAAHARTAARPRAGDAARDAARRLDERAQDQAARLVVLFRGPGADASGPLLQIPSVITSCASAHDCRSAFAGAYSGDSHHARAAATSGNSSSTSRSGRQSPSLTSVVPPRAM